MADDSLIAPIVAALSAGEPALAEQQGRPHDALAVLGRLVELCPEDSLHWANYAGALAHAGNLEAAERAAETAAHCALNDPERLDQLGLMQLGNGKPAIALATLMRAYDLAPD